MMRRLGLSLLLAALALPTLGVDTPAISSITVTRRGCMGSCPVYSLTLNEDGSATYIGSSYVPRIGTYVAHVNFDAFLAIVAPYDPWSMTDVQERATDSPSLAITMVRGGETKTVHLYNYTGMPTRFAAIVSAMDGLTAYTEWSPKSVATEFAGAYLDFRDFSTLDELFVRADPTGSMYAFRVRATSDSCQNLLLPKPVELGTLSPENSPWHLVRLADGSEMQHNGTAISWTSQGKTTVFTEVDSNVEFMIRGAFEGYAERAAHLSCL